MRCRVRTHAPLKPIQAWIELDGSSIRAFRRSLEQTLGLEPGFQLEIDGFALLDASSQSVIASTDIVDIKAGAAAAPIASADREPPLKRQRLANGTAQAVATASSSDSSSDSSSEDEPAQLPVRPVAGPSKPASSSSSSSSSSDSSESSSSDDEGLASVKANGIPFQGSPATHQRNARRRQKEKIRRAEQAVTEATGAVRPIAPAQTVAQMGGMLSTNTLQGDGALNMLSLSNKNRNKRKGFRAGLAEAAGKIAKKIVFRDDDSPSASPTPVQQPAPVQQPTTAHAPTRPSPAPSQRSFKNPEVIPFSMRPPDQIPRGIRITKVDVLAPDHVPGQTMPHYQPQLRATRRPSPIYQPPEPDSEEEETGDWAGWPLEETINAQWTSLPKILALKDIAAGDRIALRILELTERGLPALVTYSGFAVQDANLISTEPSLTLRTYDGERSFHWATIAGCARLSVAST